MQEIFNFLNFVFSFVLNLQILDCQGTCELHDIQLNQLSTTQFNEIVEPQSVFEFDWSGKNVLSKIDVSLISVKAKNSGTVQAFFMWWILKMDQEGEIRISCAPHWCHEDFERLKCEKLDFIPQQNVLPWRDHWMQAIYYMPKPIHVEQGEQLQLQCFRDEFSLWFNLVRESKAVEINEIDNLRPLCTCGFHLAYSRTRIGQMNETTRTKKFLKIFENEISDQSVVLFVSDGSLIGLALAALNAKHVYYLDANSYSRKVIEKYVKFNKLVNVTLVADHADENIEWSQITHIISEPNLCTSILPWDSFDFAELIKNVADRIGNDVKILPCTASIVAIPVEFLDLQKIIAPFQICESFDLSIFDKIIEVSLKHKFSVFSFTIQFSMIFFSFPEITYLN